MNFTLLTILSGIFGLLCIGREVLVIVRAKQIRIINLFLIMYGLTYGVVFSLVLYLYNAGVYQINGIYLRFDYSSYGITYSTYWLMAAVAGYFSFRFASVLCIRKNHKKQVISQSMLNQRLLERLQITNVICLLIGIGCFSIWANGWGGYLNLFLNAAEIRNGSYGIKNPVAFFAKPAQIVATVSIISLYLIKQKNNIWLNVWLFIISFAISLMYYLAKDGRMVMAMYLIIILFMWNGTFEKQENMGRKFVHLLLLFAFFIMVVINMDSLTYFMRNDAVMVSEEEPIWKSILDELSYIYVSGQTSMEQYINQGSPMLFYHEAVLSLFAWVPSSLTPKGFINIWDYNTHLIAGYKAVAQYPSDIISTSLYDFGLLGPILLPGLWGIVISNIDRINQNNKTPLFSIVYYSLSMTLLRVVNYSMMYATIASVFHVFVMTVVFWLISHVRWRK